MFKPCGRRLRAARPLSCSSTSITPVPAGRFGVYTKYMPKTPPIDPGVCRPVPTGKAAGLWVGPLGRPTL